MNSPHDDVLVEVASAVFSASGSGFWFWWSSWRPVVSMTHSFTLCQRGSYGLAKVFALICFRYGGESVACVFVFQLLSLQRWNLSPPLIPSDLIGFVYMLPMGMRNRSMVVNEIMK